MPRRNDFYPYNPPSDEDPNWTERDPCVHSSGVKLCKLCGCPGQKVCSKCHAVSYCSKEHQTIDWKHCHKKECCKQGNYTATINCHTICNNDEIVFSARLKHKNSTFNTCLVPSSAVPSPFLFPELELVTEPEEHQKEESSQTVGDAQNNVECSSLVDGKKLDCIAFTCLVFSDPLRHQKEDERKC